MKSINNLNFRQINNENITDHKRKEYIDIVLQIYVVNCKFWKSINRFRKDLKLNLKQE